MRPIRKRLRLMPRFVLLGLATAGAAVAVVFIGSRALDWLEQLGRERGVLVTRWHLTKARAIPTAKAGG